MLGALHKEAIELGEVGHAKEGIKQADYIFRKFAEKLSADNGMHRSVSYFADALFYSPKYLSKVVKKTCGRTPLELINETAIEHIKHRRNTPNNPQMKLQKSSTSQPIPSSASL